MVCQAGVHSVFLEAMLTMNRTARSELCWKKPVLEGVLLRWGSPDRKRLHEEYKERAGIKVKLKSSAWNCIPCPKRWCMGRSLRRTWKKCTMNPIEEEPQFDDYFAKVISHVKENHEQHQLRKEALTPLPLFCLLPLTVSRWVGEKGFGLKGGKEKTMPLPPLHSWSIKLWLRIKGTGGEKLFGWGIEVLISTGLDFS